MIFSREKDWRDIAELVYAMADELDRGYVREWLERIVGAEDARYTRFEESLARLG